MKSAGRRRFLQSSLGGLAGLASLPLVGGLGGCQHVSGQAAALPVQKLADRVRVIGGAPGNVLVLDTGDGALLVDAGSATLARAVRASLGGVRVKTLINTHYHADQTGGNALFGAAGADIRSHMVTQEWLSTDFYVPADDRWVKALPPNGRPTFTFHDKDEMTAGVEVVESGYLVEAHTRGDIYVLFRNSNVLAVGDVASPLRDPALDWYAGGWLGGRVDAMTELLAVANEQTQIVPAYGAVMTRAQLQAERDMMQKLYERTTLLTTQGRSAQDMLDAGVIKEVNRQFEDPYRFLYDVSKGLWAHYTNFGGNIV